MSKQRSSEQDPRLTRRDFLASSALAAGMAAGGLGAVLGAGRPAAAAVSPPLPKRRLGRTGMEITAFSLGAIGADPEVFKAGLARGINFIHCATGYGTLERVAEAMASRPKRPFLGMKYERPGRTDWEYLNRALQALKVDHVDILFFPLNSPDQARDRTHLEFFTEVKKQRKARFMGITSHSNMAPTLQAAVEAGFWDVLMPSYVLAPQARAELRPVLDQARKKQMGVVAMKTMTDVPTPEMGKVLKDVLTNPAVTTLCKGMLTFEHLEALLAAAATKPTRADRLSPQELARACSGSSCILCGNCPTCPRGVDVFEVVRALDYYYVHSRQPQVARTMYAGIPDDQQGSACDGCGECHGKCPYGVDLARHVQASHLLLG